VFVGVPAEHHAHVRLGRDPQTDPPGKSSRTETVSFVGSWT
jgi:hypothetical protein